MRGIKNETWVLKRGPGSAAGLLSTWVQGPDSSRVVGLDWSSPEL